MQKTTFSSYEFLSLISYVFISSFMQDKPIAKNVAAQMGFVPVLQL